MPWLLSDVSLALISFVSFTMLTCRPAPPCFLTPSLSCTAPTATRYTIPLFPQPCYTYMPFLSIMNHQHLLASDFWLRGLSSHFFVPVFAFPFSCLLSTRIHSIIFFALRYMHFLCNLHISSAAQLMVPIQVLCTSTGGKARLSEGCSFRKKQD